MATLYEMLKKISPFGLEFHDDADGIYSASLIIKTTGLEIDKMKDVPNDPRLRLRSPLEFGDYHWEVAVDLGAPKDTNWNGIVVDHHPDHPKERKYTLFWDNVPTTLIVWNHLKDHIPKEEWWRVVGGLMGDQSVELTPAEVWDYFPELFDEVGGIYKNNWKISSSKIPLYVMLSSGVNSLCRIGTPLVALKKCLEWKSPLDALTDPDVKDAKDVVAREEAQIYKTGMRQSVISNKVALIIIRTSSPNYSMSGYIASTLAGQRQYKFLTVVVLNEANGEVSIRGTLAKYVADKLRARGYKAGGHACASGCSINPQDTAKFVKDLTAIARGQ